MKVQKTTSMAARIQTRFLMTVVMLAGLGVASAWAAAQEPWPPVPPLEAVTVAEDAAALPSSILAKVLGPGEWRCEFRFRPTIEAKQVVLAGSFNGWDRHALPMSGPDAEGHWKTSVDLGTGVYEYKFLVNDSQWYHDPTNLDRMPDGFGGYNSFVRLGRLARMTASEAQLGDGRIDPIGLEHRPPLPLYIQPLGIDEALIRYRTLARDVEHVWLAIHGDQTVEMRSVSEGPLFKYWEALFAVPEARRPRSPNVHSFEYTFVLEDGGHQACDPHTYRFSFTKAGVFETPEWAKHAVWYQVMLDRFSNGDPANDAQPVRPWTSAWFTPSPWEGESGRTFYEYVFDRFYGGDLDGLEARLPYLQELGVNALYLNPIFKAPSNHKYDVENYLHVDDAFGTRGDYDQVAAQEDLLDPATWQWTETDRRFLAFLNKAHELGFKVILDGVFNHVGITHPAFVDVRERGQDSPYADWFVVSSWEPFEYKGWAGFERMPVFQKSRAGFASPEVRKHILAVTRRWMDPNGDGNPRDGIDGWRLDVPNDIPRPFWKQWRTFVKKINPDALITGEIWHRADQWLDGQHFDAVMNYQFAKVAVKWIIDRAQKIRASEAASRLAELRLAYPAAATYALQNLVDSHDTDRLASMVRNPDRVYDRQNRVQDDNPDYDNGKPSAEDYARARLVSFLQMTYVGAPMIYYGDEVGMWGADDPTNRKPMLWKDLEPYENAEDNAVMVDQLEFYKQAIALRNSHPALRTGSFETLLVDDEADVWAFLRADASEQIVVVLNASDAPRAVRVPVPEGAPSSWETVFGEGGRIEVGDGALPVSVPAIGGASPRPT